MLNTTRTATTTALALVRDSNVTLEQLAQHFKGSIDFAAGLVDAVQGDRFFADGCIDWCEMDEAVKADYRAGFAAGEALVEAAALADGWADCYATAAVEAARAAELLPVAADDCPF